MKVIRERVFESDVSVLIADNGEIPILVAGDYKQVMTIKQAENQWMLSNGYERVGGVNCGFFQMGNGEMLNQCLTDWDNVKISKTGYCDGVADIGFDGSKIVVGDFPDFQGCQWMRGLSWGILKDSKEWNLVPSNFISNANSYQPRTMIGSNKQNQTVLIVVDGRGVKSKIDSTKTSKGITRTQQIELAKRYDLKHCVNADGGGSSVIEYKGEILNNPSDGSLRKCSDFVILYGKKENKVESDNVSYKFTKYMIPSNKYSLKCPYSMTPQYVTIHDTANQAPAINEAKYMTGNEQATSFHFVCDESEVIQCAELNRNCFHAGDGGSGTGNRKSIGVEIARPTNTNRSLYDRAEENAVYLSARLLFKYGLGIDRLKKHQDWSNKKCPNVILSENRWESFKDRVRWVLDEIKKGNVEVDIESGTTGLKKTESVPNKPVDVPVETTKHFRVVISSNAVRENANVSLANVKAKGVDAFIAIAPVNNVTYYRVVSGSYSNRDNAVVRQNELKKLGISSFLVFE